MKLITIISLMLLFVIEMKATVYTFHTAGSYSDSSNWDIYPGNYFYTNDTISIEANCWDIDLVVENGYVLFSENVSEIGIDWLTLFSSDCQLEFLSNYLSITISGSIDFIPNGFYNTILTPANPFIVINNSGYGISSNTCPIWQDYGFMVYYNDGIQDAEFLGCMNGIFFNFGTIEVSWSTLNLNCDLDLSSGTITGSQPFSIVPYNGTIMQSCSNCVATINNIITLHINKNSEFNGQVALNGP